MRKTLIRKIAAFCIVLLLAATTSCKKDNIQPNLAGTWSHVQQVGSFRDILTQIDLDADGNGKETVMSITTAATTTTSEINFSWTTLGDTELIIKPEGESEERYNFILDEVNKQLTLTQSSTGLTKVFFKNE
jgi:hypothetical protein